MGRDVEQREEPEGTLEQQPEEKRKPLVATEITNNPMEGVQQEPLLKTTVLPSTDHLEIEVITTEPRRTMVVHVGETRLR